MVLPLLGSYMTFDRLKKSALAEEIVANLLTLIKERRLQAGDRLPPERELAAMLGVSRPSLREALRALSVMNVIEMRQGDGTYVTSLDPQDLVEHLGFVFSLDDSTFSQLLEARRVVEPGLAAIAAQRITDEQLERLDAYLDQSQHAVGDSHAFLEADLALHELITESAGNPILTRFMASISQLGRASRLLTVEIPGVPEQAAEAHRAIVAALKARDPEAAREAMTQHLNMLTERLKTRGIG